MRLAQPITDGKRIGTSTAKAHACVNCFEEARRQLNDPSDVVEEISQAEYNAMPPNQNRNPAAN